MRNLLMMMMLLLTAVFPIAAQQLITPTLVDSVPVRDGKKIAIDIYIPDGGGGSQYSCILVQTPYNRQAYRVIGLPLYGNDVSGSPFAFVIADWRGFYGSAAAQVAGYDRGKDGYDIVEWIAQQAWSNGRIGTWGPSALGKIQFQTAKKRPPHLVCCVPLVAGSQFNYQEYYPGGVYRTEYIEQLDGLGFGLSLVVNPYQTYDNVWKFIIEPPSWYPDSISVPMFMIGGWYDHNITVMMELFEGLRNESFPAVRLHHRLLMGPWAHGGFGPAHVGSAQQGELFYYEAEGWSDSLAINFLRYWLDSIPNNWENTPVIRYFQMGENTWQASSTWPATDVSPYNLYFHPGGMLYPEVPFFTGNYGILSYDPRDPSPTIGGATLRSDLEQGPYDQAPIVESRSDILKFTSIELGQNVVMKGSATVHLYVSCDRKDTDYAIRLTDVYPDGRSMLLAEGIRRLRFRDGYQPSDTALGVPGTVYELVITLPDIANTFLSGHRIRVDVTSSNYPRYDCNLNNGLAMYTAGDTLVATSQVQINSVYSSYIELPLVNFTGSIDQSVVEGGIFVYPNPAGETLYLTSPGYEGVIRIFNVQGQCVYSITKVSGNDPVSIDIRDLPQGIYIIHCGSQIQKFMHTKY